MTADDRGGAARGETFLVFRPRELPSALTRSVPPDAALRDCLCYILRQGSSGTEGLFEALPEPPIDHAALGMALVKQVLRLVARSRRLSALLCPEETGDRPSYLGVCRVGFHAGNADDVEAWLRARGHRLVPVREVLDTLLLLLPTTDGGLPAGRLALFREVDGGLVGEELSEAVPGVLALERPGVTEGPLTLRSGRYRARLASLPATGLYAVRLTAGDPKPARAARRGVVEAETLSREEVASLLDPRGVAHDPQTSWPIASLLPSAIARGVWDPALGGRVLRAQQGRRAIAEAVVARWIDHVLDGDEFQFDDLSAYREAMRACEKAVGAGCVRSAAREALARRRAAQRGGYQRLTAPRAPRWAPAGPGVSRCVECLRPVRGRRYVFRCDRGHEGQAHPACVRPHVARLLGDRSQGELACSLAPGCHLVSCARGGVADDPYGARLLRAVQVREARLKAVTKVLLALESSGLVEQRVGWTAHVVYWAAVDQAGAREGLDRLVDALDASKEFREGVRVAVRRELRLG